MKPNLLITIIIILIIAILLIFFTLDISVNFYYKNEKFTLKPDTYDNQVKKADLLIDLKEKINKLIDYLRLNNIPSKEAAERLYTRFKTTNVRETSLFESSAGYTINKGHELRLCINKVNGVYQPDIVMFIMLHELAHILSITYGHNQEFKENMDLLVKEAVKIGIYSGQDYTQKPVDYCGVVIRNSPCSFGSCKLN